jgi:hypothetical protein
MQNQSTAKTSVLRQQMSVKERMRTQRQFLPSLCSTTVGGTGNDPARAAAAAAAMGGRSASQLDRSTLPPLSQSVRSTQRNHNAALSDFESNGGGAALLNLQPWEDTPQQPQRRSESVPLRAAPRPSGSENNNRSLSRPVHTPSFRLRRRLQGPGSYRLPLNDDELSDDDELDERLVRREAMDRHVRSCVGTPAEGVARPARTSTPLLSAEHPQSSSSTAVVHGSIPLVDDDIAVPERVLRSLVAFDMSVEEKQLLADYVRNGKQGPAPTLVVGYFKYSMASSTALFQVLREEVPLAVIERVVGALHPTATYNFAQFVRQVLTPIVQFAAQSPDSAGGAPFASFLPIPSQDAVFLFDLFDTDDDGQLAKGDLCNGFVLLRSVDGPLIPVLHRCITMVAPTAKREAKLAMITRLEVQHMCEAIVTVVSAFVENARRNTKLLKEAVTREYPPVAPKGKEMLQLKAQQHDVRLLVSMLAQCREDLQTLSETFACDRRGSLSYYEVREFLIGRPAVKHAISLLRVPRDEDLWESFLSESFRTATVDEVSSRRDFRPSRNPLLDAVEGNRKLMMKGTSSNNDGWMGNKGVSNGSFAAADALAQSTVVAVEREAVEHHAPVFYSMKGTLFCQSKDAESPQVVAKGVYVLEDAKGRKVRNLF